MSRPDLAVLIDAENVPGGQAQRLFAMTRALGDISVCRAYGDFTNGALKSWSLEIMGRHGILPMQAFGGAKNASDIALTIDAMELLYTRPDLTFCLVSSDSDFSRLALKLREAGRTVIGFGERKARESFQNACSEFRQLEASARPKAAAPAKSVATAGGKTTAAATALQSAVLKTLRALSRDKPNDWISFSQLGKQVRADNAGKTPLDFGNRWLSKTLADMHGDIHVDEKGQRCRLR